MLHLALGGLIVGLAISTMHYMGMEGMKFHVNIHYLPGLFFFLSLLNCRRGNCDLVSFAKQLWLKEKAI